MNLTYAALADKLPPGAVEFVGNNQLKLNISQLTGDTLTTDSSLIEGIVKLMQSLAILTNSVNDARGDANPPLPPINFCSQDLVGTPDQPEFEFTVRVAVNTAQFVNNLVDPTE